MSIQSKILIADDDASIRLVLSQAFSRLGYQVRATSNAATLLKWVTDGEGDLVITDVVMPDENVFDVLPRIRKQRPRLPVIVMSAQNTLLTAVNAAEIGAYDYVPKPFDLDDMTAAARRALARPNDTEVAKAQARALLADAREHVEHVLVRHDDVGDDEIALPIGDPLQQGRGVGGGANLITEARERLAQDQSDRCIVIGDKDLALDGHDLALSCPILRLQRQQHPEAGAPWL